MTISIDWSSIYKLLKSIKPQRLILSIDNNFLQLNLPVTWPEFPRKDDNLKIINTRRNWTRNQFISECGLLSKRNWKLNWIYCHREGNLFEVWQVHWGKCGRLLWSHIIADGLRVGVETCIHAHMYVYRVSMEQQIVDVVWCQRNIVVRLKSSA